MRYSLSRLRERAGVRVAALQNKPLLLEREASPAARQHVENQFRAGKWG